MADLNAYFKSIIDQDREAVVICDLDHTILYMNPAAVVDYGKYSGAALLGKSLLACHNPHSVEAIRKVVEWFAADASHNIVYTYHNAKHDRDVYMVAPRDASGTLIGYYEKHDSRKAETMKQYDLFWQRKANSTQKRLCRLPPCENATLLYLPHKQNERLPGFSHTAGVRSFLWGRFVTLPAARQPAHPSVPQRRHWRQSGWSQRHHRR